MVDPQPQYGLNDTRVVPQDLVQYIDEYECDPDSCSDEEHSELQSHNQYPKKTLCCKKKKKSSGNRDNYFKTLFSFDKMFETINTVNRLEMQVGQVDVLNAVAAENRDLKEQMEVQGKIIEQLTARMNELAKKT